MFNFILSCSNSIIIIMIIIIILLSWHSTAKLRHHIHTYVHTFIHMKSFLLTRPYRYFYQCIYIHIKNKYFPAMPVKHAYIKECVSHLQTTTQQQVELVVVLWFVVWNLLTISSFLSFYKKCWQQLPEGSQLIRFINTGLRTLKVACSDAVDL